MISHWRKFYRTWWQPVLKTRNPARSPWKARRPRLRFIARRGSAPMAGMEAFAGLSVRGLALVDASGNLRLHVDLSAMVDRGDAFGLFRFTK